MLNKIYSFLILSLFAQTIFAQTDFFFVKIQPESIADTIPSNQLGTTIDWGGEVNEPIIGELVYAPEDLNGNRFLCDTPMVDFTNKIALIDRGECFFTEKALQAQQLGAIGVVIRNFEDSIVSLGATADFTGGVNIPVVMIPNNLGAEIESVLLNEDTLIVGFLPELSLKVITFREEVNLKVYPNPMKSISSFELEGINGKDGILQVFDSMGRLVKEKSFSQNKFQLSRDNLPSGNYFFKISIDQIPILATGMLQVID